MANLTPEDIVNLVAAAWDEGHDACCTVPDAGYHIINPYRSQPAWQTWSTTVMNPLREGRK